MLDGEIHVLYTTLEGDAGELLALLDEEERLRAARYRTAVLQRRFIAGRAFLRTVLGTVLDVDPRQLRFGYGPAGKPFLDAPLRFNLSHSDDMALLALSAGGEIGADIERIRPDLEHGALARRFFSPSEESWLSAVPAHERAAAFCDCWTAKEAYIKGRGDGMRFPLDAFHVLPGRGEQLDFEVYGDPRESARWSVRHVLRTAEYRAAIAAEGGEQRVDVRRWPFRS